MKNDPTLSYQFASACGASPIGHIIALYDTILRDFRRALAALQAKDIEARVFELNHAIVVIGHLQYVLDYERGGEPAKHFADFYTVTRGMILQANIKATPEPIEELIELYSGVRQAWHQAEQQTHAGQTPAPAATQGPGHAAATPEMSRVNEDEDAPQLQWSA
jgi:flagellar protein FliS